MRSALVVEVQCAKARVYHYILCQSSVLTWENQHINRPTSLRSARSRPRRHGSVTRLENHCDQPRKCDSTAGRSLASSGNPSSVASKEPGSHIIAGTTGGKQALGLALSGQPECVAVLTRPQVMYAEQSNLAIGYVVFFSSFSAQRVLPPQIHAAQKARHGIHRSDTSSCTCE